MNNINPDALVFVLVGIGGWVFLVWLNLFSYGHFVTR